MTSMTRRSFLARLAAGASIVAVGGDTLSACGSSQARSTNSTGTTIKPRRGGSLRAGLSGGTSSDTLNALSPLNQVDDARVINLFDSLLVMDAEGKPVPSLATEVSSNKEATVWTIRLRDGVAFHNGKPFTAEDVIHTFHAIANPKSLAAAAPWFTPVDMGGLKAVDKLTVLVPCKTPFSYFPEVLSAPAYGNIVPVGYDVHKPIGTGPYKLQSFSPGVASTFVRNSDYFQEGLPYTDSLIITDYADEQSQINALESGEVDVIDNLSADAVSGLQSTGGKVLINNTSGDNPIFMRTDSAPFNDVRVRQAMRLIVDRPEMLKVLFGSHGYIGNDIFGHAAPGYDHEIPQRRQDISQAKHLLKAAGHENLTVTMVTSNLAQGLVSEAQVFAQQAQQAGVTVNLRQVTPSLYFGPNFLKWVFSEDWWYYYYYLAAVAFRTLHGAVYNETHFNNARYNSLFSQAAATVDKAKRYEIEHEMMRIDWSEGGYIIPFFVPVIDGYSTKTNGLVPSISGLSLNGYNFKYLWLS